MTPSKNIDLIIFDCDGVLVNSEIIASISVSDYLNNLGIPTTPKQVTEQYVGRSLASCKAMLEAQGHRIPENFVENIRSGILESLSHGLDAIPFIHQTLDQISQPVCVASSGRPVKIEQSLRMTGLTDYFGDNIFSATQVENPKPAPDLFLLAAQTMGFSPARTLVIEDSSVGVEGGVAAGMIVAGFTGGSHCEAGHGDTLKEIGAQYIVASMDDLPTLIGNL